MPTALQEFLYAAAYRRARSLLGPLSRELASYEKTFLASLPEAYTPSSWEDLLGALNKHQLILYGDFHTLPSTQTAFRSLLARAYRRRSEGPLIVALECFQARHQGILDAYLNGSIDEDALLAGSGYQKNWGFPWHHYRPILLFAKKRGLQVLALNKNFAGPDSLQQRDDFIARRLIGALEDNPCSQIYALVGEQHLGAAHLPAYLIALAPQLWQTAPPLRILSNCERYFFAMLADPRKPCHPYLHLGPDLYCLMMEPPWYKWLSHSLWSDCLADDGKGPRDARSKLNYSVLGAEIDDYFLDVVKLLANFLGVAASDELLVNYHFKILAPDTRLSPLSGRLALAWHSHFSQLRAPTTYELNLRTNTITWSAFAWDGFLQAAGEFLFYCLRQGELKHHDLPDPVLAGKTASYLTLLVLNPMLVWSSGIPAAVSPAFVQLDAALLKPYLRQAKTTSRPGPPSHAAQEQSLAPLLAQYLYSNWQQHLPPLAKLQLIFSPPGADFAHFLQRIHKDLPGLLPAPSLRPYRSASVKGSKSR